MFYLFIFEFLGTTELLVILVVALVLFGPRKLPQLSRSLGKSLGEFKRASEEFKQTWEREVALESVEKEHAIEQAMLPEDNSILGPTVGRQKSTPIEDIGLTPTAEPSTIDGAQPSAFDASGETTETADAPPEPMRKRDWL
ncbi:MAG: twin-arginine translocase TatA/TatE family subunit [Pyrinomonadaceae bacterium]|nr:twin-arginine translocase TatA/TatE family subunit [Pyrinomonadaceae bacterium]